MKTKDFNNYLKNIHNKECFDKIYEEYYPIIIKFVFKHFHDIHLGKDVAHDFFSDLLQRKIDYVKNPNAYIFTAVHNLALKYKKKDEKVCLEDCDMQYGIIDAFDKTEIDFVLSKLNKEEKEIIELKWLLGYNLKEIAQMKGYTLVAIQKRHQRILKNLQSYLK